MSEGTTFELKDEQAEALNILNDRLYLVFRKEMVKTLDALELSGQYPGIIVVNALCNFVTTVICAIPEDEQIIKEILGEISRICLEKYKRFQQ